MTIILDVSAAEMQDGIRTAVIYPPLLGEDDGSIIGGSLYIYVAVQNLDYSKKVGIVYTTDGWNTWNTAFGSYQESYSPGPLPSQAQVETWAIQISVGSTPKVEFAIFYNVRGNTYWDNNYGLNYIAQVTALKVLSAPIDDPEKIARKKLVGASSAVATVLHEQEPAQKPENAATPVKGNLIDIPVSLP